jgi:DNA-binding NarL/FixJ family response regulator
MTTVLIVDDHYAVRVGLNELLRSAPDLDVVGMAHAGDTAIEMAAALRPDVVLMDIALPVVDGIEATRTITQQRPDAVVLILSTYDDAGHMEQALAAGAHGYMRKDVLPEALVAGIRNAADNWVSFLPGVEPPLRLACADGIAPPHKLHKRVHF